MGSITQTGKAALEALGRRNTDQNAYASLNRFLAREGKYKATDLDFLTSGKDAINKWIDLDLQQREQAKKAGKPLTTLDETAPTLSESNFISVDDAKPAKITTKNGKVVKAIIKQDGTVKPARGENEIKRGRQAGEHRQAITVSKGKVVNIYLEPEFNIAADKAVGVLGIDRKEWFKQVINNNTDLNPTAALRVAIVSELTKLLGA